MVEPTFKIKIEKELDSWGRFAIEPLEKGYGSTVGNGLRRVLLSSLKGSGITKVKIAGVKHQFSTISGLKEDVIQFILNLKKVRLIHDQDEAVTMKLVAKGPGKIYAKEIKGVSDIVNKDLYLGELTSAKAKLDVEMTVESGYGYRTQDDYEGPKELGVIIVDTLFSPVTRVNFKVEATRVGRMTNLDKLILEIWTDGTIKPFDALKSSARILVSYYSMIAEPGKDDEVKEKVQKEKETDGLTDEVLRLTLEELDLPTRIVNALHNGGVDTVRELLELPKEKLYKIKNLGAKSIKSVEEVLSKKGLIFEGN